MRPGDRVPGLEVAIIVRTGGARPIADLQAAAAATALAGIANHSM